LALLLMWTVLVAVVSSPTSGLAVYEDGAVSLGNMYYFTWAGFITGVVLLGSFLESFYGINVTSAFRSDANTSPNTITAGGASANTLPNATTDIKSPSTAFVYWTALMVASLIVMGTASDIYNRQCEVAVDLKPQPFCSRTVFTITTGTISTISCLLIVISKLLYFTVPFLLEVSICSILFILYMFEVYFATGTNGPGSPLGNLYYFSWIAFLICFGIGKCCYEDYVYVLEMAELEFEQGRRRTNVPSLDTHGDVDGMYHGDVEMSQGRAEKDGENITSPANSTNSNPETAREGNAIDNKEGERDVEL